MKLTPTNRTDYGIRALIYLANHQGAHAKAADIGGAMDIPTGFLQQVLQELQRAGSSARARAGRRLRAGPAARGHHDPRDRRDARGAARDARSARARRAVPLGRRVRHALGVVLGPGRPERQPDAPPRWPGWRPTTGGSRGTRSRRPTPIVARELSCCRSGRCRLSGDTVRTSISPVTVSRSRTNRVGASRRSAMPEAVARCCSATSGTNRPRRRRTAPPGRRSARSRRCG